MHPHDIRKVRNALIAKLIEKEVKDLSEPELKRAFADTVAPRKCITLVKRLGIFYSDVQSPLWKDK